MDELILDNNMSAFAISRTLKNGGFDMVFNLRESSFRTDVACFLTRKSIKSYTNSRRRIADYVYTINNKINVSEIYRSNAHLDLLNMMSTENYGTEVIFDLIEPQLLDKNSLGVKSVCIVPCGSGSLKKWPINKYVEVANDLSSSLNGQCELYFILGPTEADYVSKIPAEIGGRPVNIVQSPSVMQLIELASVMDLLILNDCAPAHIFQMAKLPMIMLIGWRGESSPFQTAKKWYVSSNDSYLITPSEDEKLLNTVQVDKVLNLAKLIIQT